MKRTSRFIIAVSLIAILAITAGAFAEERPMLDIPTWIADSRQLADYEVITQALLCAS